jgi:hypothetical protein
MDFCSPCPTLLCPVGESGLKRPYLRSFQGWPARRAVGLRPSSTPLDTPRRTLMDPAIPLSACMARMVGASGRVVGVDHIPQLVQGSLAKVKQDDPDLLRHLEVIDLTLDDGAAHGGLR